MKVNQTADKTWFLDKSFPQIPREYKRHIPYLLKNQPPAILDLFRLDKSYPLIGGELELTAGQRALLEDVPNYSKYTIRAEKKKISNLLEPKLFDALQQEFKIDEILHIQDMLKTEGFARYEILADQNIDKRKRSSLLGELNQRLLEYLITTTIPYSRMENWMKAFGLFDLVSLRAGDSVKTEIAEELKKQNFCFTSNMKSFIWWKVFALVEFGLPVKDQFTKKIPKNNPKYEFKPLVDLSRISERVISPVGCVTIPEVTSNFQQKIVKTGEHIKVPLYSITDLIDFFGDTRSFHSSEELQHLIARIHFAGAFIPQAGSLDDLGLRQCGLTTIREEEKNNF